MYQSMDKGVWVNFGKNEFIVAVHSDLHGSIYVHWCCHSNITN